MVRIEAAAKNSRPRGVIGGSNFDTVVLLPTTIWPTCDMHVYHLTFVFNVASLLPLEEHAAFAEVARYTLRRWRFANRNFA